MYGRGHVRSHFTKAKKAYEKWLFVWLYNFQTNSWRFYPPLQLTPHASAPAGANGKL